MITPLPEVADLIEDAEKHLGLSTAQLSEKLGVPEILLAEWKKGLFPAVYYPLLLISLTHLISEQNRAPINELLDNIKKEAEERKQKEAAIPTVEVNGSRFKVFQLHK